MMLGLVERLALADDPAIDVEAVRRGGLRSFVRLAWPEVESAHFINGWHIDLICAHLEAVSRGEIERLVINVPPGCSKSRIVSVLWPAWVWSFEPEHKWMAATFDSTLAQRDAMAMRALVKSDWYQARWPDTVVDETGGRKDTQGVFFTTDGGFRYSTTVRGGATGWHCHTQILDDPNKPSDLQGNPDSARRVLDETWEWWRSTMASRKADPKRFARVVIMQRLHERDIAQRCIEEDYVHVMLPMRAELERRCVTAWGSDPRAADGELLNPERFDELAVERTEEEMGSRTAAAQLAQRPAPAEGNIFKRDWLLKEWTVLPASLELIQSWDLAFKDTATADFVCGQVWGYADGKFYLVDQMHDRMGMPATIAAIKAMARMWPRAIAKIIEDKANGPAVEQTLRQDTLGIIMVTPEGGKVARANACSPFFEAGNVLVPSALTHPWVDAWREELASFPFSANDDRVDATTQALAYLHAKGNATYIQAVKMMAAQKAKGYAA